MTVADVWGWEVRRSDRPLRDFSVSSLIDQETADLGIDVGAGGEIRFVAEAGSQTSKGDAVVCELRQHSSTGESWTASEEGYLSASLSITAIPAGDDGADIAIAVARVHGATGELAALVYDGRQLQLMTSHSSGGSRRKIALTDAEGGLPLIALGERFDCFIRVNMTTIWVSVIHRGRTYLCSAETDGAWLRSPLHFSAGVCFDQEGSSGRAEAKFFSLASPSLPRPSRHSSGRGRDIASAELVVKLADGERLTLPMAVPRSRHVRH